MSQSRDVDELRLQMVRTGARLGQSGAFATDADSARESTPSMKWLNPAATVYSTAAGTGTWKTFQCSNYMGPLDRFSAGIFEVHLMDASGGTNVYLRASADGATLWAATAVADGGVGATGRQVSQTLVPLSEGNGVQYWVDGTPSEIRIRLIGFVK